MRRALIAVLALLLAAPAAAQQKVTVPSQRLTVTPIFGVRGALAADRSATVAIPALLFPAVVRFETENDYRGVAGLEADLRLFGPVGVTAAVMTTSPDQMLFITESDQAIYQTTIDGPSVLLARAGLSVRLPEVQGTRGVFPAGFLWAGPALIREDYRSGPLSLGSGDETDNWGVSVGYRALIPIGSRHAYLQVGLENTMILWEDDAREEERIRRVLDLDPATPPLHLDYDRVHIPMLTAGIAFRL